METFSVISLLYLSTLLGVQNIPEINKDWKILTNWNLDEHHPSFSAESETISSKCSENPEHYIKFPSVIHGSHSLFLDGKLIYQFGDPSFKTVQSFYGAPLLKCTSLQGGKKLTWMVKSYSRYFARIQHYPLLSKSRPLVNVPLETLNVIAAGFLFILALFGLTIFWGKVDKDITISLLLSNTFTSLYFFLNSSSFFGLHFDMLTSHKIADSGLWIGVLFLIKILKKQKLVSKTIFAVYISNVLIGLLIILSGSSGDTIQFGTSLPFFLTLGILTYAMYKLSLLYKKGKAKRRRLLQISSLGFFVISAFNDISVVTGLQNGPVFLSVGLVGAMLFLTLGVNEKIVETYNERDYLRSNLEKEVIRKTSDLESAMTELKNTQSELIQSAKLASLGTLSAGIAHEINNSLNYVNGALGPLQKLLEKETLNSQKKISSLIGVMKEGLTLTFKIIKSLRSYTGLNQAEFNDVKIGTVVSSVLTILKGKISSKVKVEVDISEEAEVFGNVVGLNQVFMNLIGNAIDAMPDGGSLRIRSRESNDHVEILVCDTGNGIPSEILDRIYEPFFTTKKVGSGTGLGLHIVKKELESHGGTLSVESTQGEGTTFKLTFPKRQQEKQVA